MPTATMPSATTSEVHSGTRTRVAPATDAAVAPPAATPPLPAPFEYDPSVLVPNVETLNTTFGVELEIRPPGWDGTQTPGPSGPHWTALCMRLLRAGVIDPARRKHFEQHIGNIYALFEPPGGRGSQFVECRNSPFWSQLCHYLHPDLRAVLSPMADTSDAGGDELKSPILTTAAQTQQFFRALYNVAQHVYDFHNTAGCGMHIHVGRREGEARAAHARVFERFVISREWMFQLLVPRYRRHGYNRVWRTDTLAGLHLRGAMASSASASVVLVGQGGGITTSSGTFDGDIQAYFESLDVVNGIRLPDGSALRAAVIDGYRAEALQVPLPSTHGHWVCGGRHGNTTEFRLFAPPPNPTDVINWIRLLNHIWGYCDRAPDAARRRSLITPYMSANAVLNTFFAECPNVPADLQTWMMLQSRTHAR